MNGSLSRRQQRLEPFIAGLAEFVQPGKASAKRMREFEGPAPPAAIVLRIVTFEERKLRLMDARLVCRVKFSDPAGRFGHGALLSGGAFVNQIADAYGAGNVLEDEPGPAAIRIRRRAQALGTEIRQRLQQAAINLRFISDAAAMPERIVTVTSLVLDKHTAFVVVRPLAGHDLIRKCTHHPRQLSIKDSYPFAARIVTVERGGETRGQRLHIRQKRRWRLQRHDGISHCRHLYRLWVAELILLRRLTPLTCASSLS